ncbi:MAG: ABC transporter ATP-binding protein [Blastocatellia bacterium]|nr:MAG: ABC transporter ATP-binding protein [Blastocatellia bacterium]
MVRVTEVSKHYLIGARQRSYYTLREAVAGALRAPATRLRRNGTGSDNGVWALKDVSFEVGRGECLGIIGRNGAGKSTLLKILSRITEPTVGRVELFGRLGSLLEVGTGFHPELTGRENIFLNGALLGMRNAEIGTKFDEIVTFAEIHKFLDTPVKHYSSGMYMRLAFAVAAHLEPEILLVDEVLAVGDAEFQAKCLGKMSAVASVGRTVLFVSHNMAAIQSLCKRTIWLDEGRLCEEGPSATVVKDYLGTASSSIGMEQVWASPETAPGNDRVRIHKVCVRPLNDSASGGISIRTPFVLEFEYWNFVAEAHLNLSLHLYNEQGITVFNSFPVREPVWHGRPFPVGLFRSSCYVPGNLLNEGVHRVLLLVVEDQGKVIFSMNDALVFNVLDSIERRGDWHGKWEGAVRPDLEWKTEYLLEMNNIS